MKESAWFERYALALEELCDSLQLSCFLYSETYPVRLLVKDGAQQSLFGRENTGSLELYLVNGEVVYRTRGSFEIGKPSLSKLDGAFKKAAESRMRAYFEETNPATPAWEDETEKTNHETI